VTYEVRTYHDGDESAWANIMNTGIGENWTAERCRESLTGRAQFLPDGLFFAVRHDGDGEVLAGSACAWRLTPHEWTVGYVHMVCVRPEHRGRRLGYWLTLAVLHYFRNRGFKRAILDTDDFRLPAIRVYLDLGFEPELTHASHPGRWDAVARALRQH
jgi:mycothiol synthase